VQIQRGLTQRLVLGLDEACGFLLVGGSQAGALAGESIHRVVDAAANPAAEQTVSDLHSFLHVIARIMKPKPNR
jgi:hypothetical protein